MEEMGSAKRNLKLLREFTRHPVIAGLGAFGSFFKNNIIIIGK